MSDIRKRIGAKGTTYQVRYADPRVAGGYAYRTFSTAKEARTFREDAAARAAQGTRRGDAWSVADAINTWLDVCEKEGRDGRAPVSSSTHKQYRYLADIMKAYQWEKGVAALAKPDIIAFRSWLIAAHGRYLAAKTLRQFHGVLGEMATRGVVPVNVCTGVGVRKETRYDEPIVIPTHEEVRALLRAADELANSKNRQTARAWARYRPMLYLAVDSGMRPQEYVAIAGANLRDGGVHVGRAIDRGGELSVTKTPAGRRFIELSPETFDMVTHYRDHLALNNDYDLVFPTAGGRWQSLDNWRKRGFGEACEHAGLIDISEMDGEEIAAPRFAPYALRHYFASALIASGTDIAKIKTLMGHTDITTTYSVYAHLIRESEQTRSQRPGLISTIRH
ncbi:MAG: site-specific integrase [Burkholderiaceae bacterium]